MQPLNVPETQLSMLSSSVDEPTIEHDSMEQNAKQLAAQQQAISGTSGGSTMPAMGMVAKGKGPRFADETEALLKLRLKAAAIDLMVVLGIGYAGNLLAGSTQWQLLRTLILGSVIGSFFILRGKSVLKMPALRAIELALFGGVAIQMGLMMYSRTEYFAGKGEAASMVGVQQFFYTAFCLHILTYGIFMPNTWRRAAVVTTALGLIPYAISYYQLWSNEALAELSSQNHAGAPLPTTLIAALIGTFGSHIIHRTRREAFQAKQIMQYRLQEQIGSGGMGDVYRAEHVLMKRPCAMKLIKPGKGNDKTTLDRFEREVIATAKLSHWNTIDIYDYGHTEDGTFYYVMELLEGDNLHSLVLLNGPFPAGRAIYLLAQACDALHEAHQSGLIHRDIKPANIFASHRGGNWDVCKLLDFGLVKEARDEENSTTRSGSFSGTPSYMPPEQVTAYDRVDGRSDLYALGAVAYFLVTGRPPFEGKTTMALIAAHATEKPIPPSQWNSSISSQFESIILKCLAKNPEDRYQTAGLLGEALRACPEAKDWNALQALAWWEAKRANYQQENLGPLSSGTEATQILSSPSNSP